jgi:hypothetical protein
LNFPLTVEIFDHNLGDRELHAQTVLQSTAVVLDIFPNSLPDNAETKQSDTNGAFLRHTVFVNLVAVSQYQVCKVSRSDLFRFTMKIINQQPSMQYRKFGKTNRWLSTITLGGMRYHDGWSEPRDQPTTQMIDQCADIVARAFAQGVNHIETAYGYGRSEHCHGIALNDVLGWRRDAYHLMTKGNADSADGIRRCVDEQLTGLKTDHIDLYAWHGINTAEKLAHFTRSGGPIEELLKMKEEGCHSDRVVQLRQPALLLLHAAQSWRGGLRGRQRTGGVYHFAE